MPKVRITYLTEPQSVDMADSWYAIADPDHFWIKRRFDVMKRLLSGYDVNSLKVAEFGCGHGIVQRQVQEAWGTLVDGFDLNRKALIESIASDHSLYCYDVFERDRAFQKRYDLIILFDILEHVEDDAAFMDAVVFHLAPGGTLLVNVPALPFLYSRYDVAAGHKQRYTRSKLTRRAGRAGLRVLHDTYWGLSLVPLLAARKLILMLERSQNRIIEKGFKPPGPIANKWVIR